MLEYAGIGWNRLELSRMGLESLEYIGVCCNMVEDAAIGLNRIE